MGRSGSLGLLLLASSALNAQEPQLIWEGEVDGTSILRVRGGSIDIQDREGLPVQRQRFRFSERLPNKRTDVELRVREGRGRVRILEQPREQNAFTLAVSIEDRQGGSSFYALEFLWRGSGGFFDFPSTPATTRQDSLVWSGRVDDEAIVECRQNDCQSRATRGGDVTRERSRFSGRMPQRDFQVSLDQTEGRGEIRLIEQPKESNDYTARVMIRDHQGGSGDYSFALSWTRRSSNDSSFAQRGLIWSGRVDGRVRVVVQGNQAQTQTISGAPVSGERAAFERSLPNRGNFDATIRRLRGRGRVEIVEYPTNRNGYRLAFEIEDSSGGSDNYEVEVGW